MSEIRYPYVAVDAGEDEADEAADLLFELGAGGVEWRDATTLTRGADGRVTLVASFEREDDARAALRMLPSVWSPRMEEVVGDEWRDEWKKYFEPFRIAGAVVVSPPWRRHEAKLGETVIVLEPGRAFGTGLHDTTSLVAELLADHIAIFRGLQVLDVGCGSGILSLVALALGAQRVRAIDVDPDAVLVTAENAARNGMSDRVDVDSAPLGAINRSYAAVVANIDAKTLVELGPALVKRVGAGGLLILGGVLGPDVSPRQLDEVRDACFPLQQWEGPRRKGDWVAIVFRGWQSLAAGS